MPISNLWSLQPGECIVAEELGKHLQNVDVYFPLRDTGIDLLVARGGRHVGLQIKESRYYPSARKRGAVGSSWHQIKVERLQRTGVDYYVFVTYIPEYGEHSLSQFKNRFLIVPFQALSKKIKHARKRASGGKYWFYFNFDGKRVVETRDRITDYSDYLENWKIIENGLGR